MTWIVYLLAAFACAGLAFCAGFLAAFLGERWALRRARERRRQGTYTRITVTPGEEWRFGRGIHVDVRGEPWVVIDRGPGYVLLWRPWRSDELEST